MVWKDDPTPSMEGHLPLSQSDPSPVHPSQKFLPKIPPKPQENKEELLCCFNPQGSEFPRNAIMGAGKLRPFRSTEMLIPNKTLDPELLEFLHLLMS